jgi:signal transduction histidine kinase/Na+-transporting methylmalonyl-CoA/oxaloacetate decarboxylase gamma subunit
MINKSISMKLGLAIILLVITILIFLSYSIHQYFVRFYTEQTISSLVTHGQMVEKMIREKELTDPSVKDVAFFMSHLMESELVLVDGDKVMFNTGVPALNHGDSIEETFSDSQNSAGIVHSITEQWIIVGIPINESRDKGIFLYAPREPIIETVNQFQRMILLSGLGAVLLAIGLTWVLSRRMVVPLLNMKEASQVLSKGNFKVKVPVKGKDEIAQLGEAINQLAQDLHRLQTSRKEFLSSVSHELRTPLSYVKGYSQALDEGMLKTEEDRKKYVKVIRQEADRLSRLVDDLFDLTQMDEGRLRLSKTQVNLNEIIGKMVHTTEPQAQVKNITLQNHSNPLPAIQGDYDRLSQVIFNLLSNAIRHTPQGGKIVVSAGVDHHQVKLVVQDTGSGIPEKDLPYVWERFYRVDKSRARGLGGTGLGLPIVKQIVEGHKGSVDIESHKGIGTTVTVTLPIHEKLEK